MRLAQNKGTHQKIISISSRIIDVFVSNGQATQFPKDKRRVELLASIVTDLWRRQESLTGTNALIHISDVNFANLDALSGQLKKLYGNGYDAVITADVSGKSSNAFRIDKSKKELGDYNLAEGWQPLFCLEVSEVLVQTREKRSGTQISIHQAKSFNHNNIHTALDLLEESAHYLYYSTSGHRRYWFHTKPNVNILINQAKGDVSNPDIETDIIRRLNEKSKGIQLFNVLVDPTEEIIPEQQKPTLVILHPNTGK
jgi:hypothetical protein